MSYLPRYIPNITQQIHHKLFCKDEVFLFPNFWDQIYVKLKKDFSISVPQSYATVVTLSYYQGRFLSPPLKTCMNIKCDVTQLNIEGIRTEDYHLKVFYSASSQAMYVKTEVVEYPAGKDGNRLMFYSFELLKHKIYFWLSSTIYHTDCTKHLQETADWSHLNVTLINQICLDETIKTLPIRMNVKYYLQPPYAGNDYSNIWELQVSLKSMSIKHDKYGYLVFKSNPIGRFCNHDTVEKYGENTPPCATLKTTVFLNVKFQNSRQVFQFGFQKFEKSSVILYPQNSTKPMSKDSNIVYKWISHKERKDINLKNRFHLLNYDKIKYSWKMAARKCK